VLLHAVALLGWWLGSRAERREPVAGADLPERLYRRRKAAAFAVQRSKLAVARRWQAVEAVVPRQEGVVRVHDGLGFAKSCADQFTGLPERHAGPVAMQLAEPVRHPLPLPVDAVPGPPVDGRRARAQRS